MGRFDFEFVGINDKGEQRDLGNKLNSLIIFLIPSDAELEIRKRGGKEYHIHPKTGVVGYNFNIDTDQRAFGYGVEAGAVSTQEELFYFHTLPLKE